MRIAAVKKTVPGSLLAAGEIALAPFSFLLYKTVRSGVKQLTQQQARKHAPMATQWLIVDGQAIKKPLELLVPMALGPRWNTHALVALAGPLHVRSTLRIEVGSAAKSAGSWTIVAHELPTYRAVANIGSLKPSSGEPWQSLHLGPGTYRLALRYYHWHDDAKLPAIEVDGEPTVPALAVPADVNDFYHTLGERSNFFYLCLHSYVSTLLRYRRWFPASFVEREYLPAGNPQTTFCYGFLRAWTRLNIELDPGLLETHDVYFTAYNRASFPILWYQLLEKNHTSIPFSVSGSYLIRAQLKARTRETCRPDRILVRALPVS